MILEKNVRISLVQCDKFKIIDKYLPYVAQILG